MKSIKWKITWQLSIFSISVLIGIVAAKFGIVIGYQFLLMCIVFWMASKIKPVFWVLLVILLGFSLGVYRGSQTYESLHTYKNLEDTNVVITGNVVNDPVISSSKQLEFVISNILIDESNMPGVIKIRSFTRNVFRGDRVVVEGKLREGFGSTQGFVYYAQVDVISSKDSLTLEVRNSFINNIYSNIKDPEASLGLGFLIGVRTLLPEELREQLSATGLTHIVAISGYNLTILVNLARRSLKRLSKYLTLALSFSFLGSFLLITGFSPSIVRASIVSVLTLLAWYYGRGFKPIVILLLSAAISGLIQPLYVWFDIGWYLSFFAFYGVLVVAPAIIKRLNVKRFKSATDLVIETFCAQLLTIPLILLIFNEMSAVSLLANVLVLPVIPLAMVATFIAGTLTWLPLDIFSWAAWPAEKILSYVVSVIELTSKFKWSLIELKVLNYQFIFMMTLILFTSVIIYSKGSITKKIDKIK